MPPVPQPSESGQRRTLIPHFVTDFTSSLKSWPVNAQWAGRMYEIPALPAVDWITAVFDGGALNWLGVFPGLCGDELARDIDEGIRFGSVDLDEVVAVAQDALTTAAGRDWWVVLKLISAVNGSWNVIGGEFAIRGVDATRISLSYWLDAALHLMLRAMEQKDHTMFLSQLELPPAGVEVPEPEIGQDSFLAMGMD